MNLCANNCNSSKSQYFKGFLHGSAVENPPANEGDAGLLPGSGRSPREGNDNPLQYSCLGNPMDRGEPFANLAFKSAYQDWIPSLWSVAFVFSLFLNLSLPLNSVGEYIYDTRETDSFICESFIPFLSPVRCIQSSLEPLLGDLKISLYVFPCSVLLDSLVTSISSQGFTVDGYR